MTKQPIPKPVNGLTLKWVPMNRAYFIILRGIVLRVINDRDEAISVFHELVANRDTVQEARRTLGGGK